MTRETRKRIAEKAYEMWEESKQLSKQIDKDLEAGVITKEEWSEKLSIVFELMRESKRIEKEVSQMSYNGYGYIDHITGLCNMG